MNGITIDAAGPRLLISTPYHPKFAPGARKLGGLWVPTGKQWSFDKRDEGRVHDLCRGIFGHDGTAPARLVSLRVDVSALGGSTDALWIAGRMVVERRGRDNSVKQGDGVILLSGGFPGSGGSMKYPSLEPRTDTIAEVRDVPIEAAEAAIAASKGAVTLVEASEVLPSTAATDAPDLVAAVEVVRRAIAAGTASPDVMADLRALLGVSLAPTIEGAE